MIDIGKVKRNPGFHILEGTYGYFLEQIEKEVGLDSIKKLECLGIISKARTPIELKELGKAYFHANKLKGPPCEDVEGLNPFVRIHHRDSFIERIDIITGSDPLKGNAEARLGMIINAKDLDARRALLLSLLDSPAVIDCYAIEEECLRFFGTRIWRSKYPPKLRDAYISDYEQIHWSFPQPTNENIFKDRATINTLPCRAGLPKKNQFIVFLHDLNASHDPRKPTVLDAGFNEHFEPGGLSKPLKDCENLSGFHEYVHKPNLFVNLKDELNEIL